MSSKLEDDDNIPYNMDKDALEQMDNEIFEPLNSFDPDMREMMIDAVNEKVRRILYLDPENFKGGKLPFGLRPDGAGAGQEELYRLEALIAQLRDELENVKLERDDLINKLEAMRKRLQQFEGGDRQHQ